MGEYMKNKMKLSTKLIIGFSLLIILIMVIATMSYFGLGASEEGFKEYRGLAREANEEGRVQANMLKARIDVKEFLDTGEDEYVNSFHESENTMRTMIENTKSLINDEERMNSIEEIESEFDTYKETFDTIQGLYEERDDIVTNNLDVDGLIMREALTDIMVSAYTDDDPTAAYYAGRLQEYVLLARLYLVKYLNTNDEADVNKAKEELNNNDVDNYINILDRELDNENRKKLFDTFKRSREKYLINIDNIQNLITTRNNLIENELDRIGDLVSANIEDMKLAVKTEQDKVGPRIQTNNQNIIILVISLAITSLVIAIAISIIIIRSVNKTLGGDPGYIADICKKVSDGILDFDFSNNTNPRGLLKNTIFMIDNLNKKGKLIDQISAGDLTVEVEKASKDDLVGNCLTRMLLKLNELIGQVNTSIEQVSEGANQISESSQVLSQGSSEQASTLEEISASVNQISSQIQTNTEGAIKANELAEKAKNNAERGSEQMKELVQAMSDIDKSANDIKNIVKVIDDIAFQTNLLALNADIEAARVGKYGKGFAVVANSVRNLAAKSQKSVKETTEMVELAIRNIQRGVELVQKTADQLEEITKGSVEVTNIAQEVSDSSQEQAKGIEQISVGLSQVEDVVQSNSANAEENAASSEELSAQGSKLRDLISYFKIDTNGKISGNGNGKHLIENGDERTKELALYNEN
jgi:methyl-accepting chemotaxis protein